MARLNGIALAQRLREGGIPVVLLSAAVADVRLPGVSYLAKPFDLDQLLEVVGRFLGDPPSRACRARPSEGETWRRGRSRRGTSRR